MPCPLDNTELCATNNANNYIDEDEYLDLDEASNERNDEESMSDED